MTNIKICHISTVHPKNDNRIFYKECTSLNQAGYNVSLIISGTNNAIINNINIYGIPKYKGRIARFLKSSIIDVYKKTNQIKADIYHFHDPELMIVGLLLKLSGKKVIYDVHENNPASIMSKPYLSNFFVKKTLAFSVGLFEKFCALFYDKIITARPDISIRFKKYNPVTLRNFPILPTYELIPEININKNKFSVIYVGGITLIRGIIPLINAFEQLTDSELWLLGSFEDENLKNQCKNLKGWKNVRFFGQVEPYEIFSYIKNADIGIITFLPVPNHITTLATKPFEYMACGLPIIMSDFAYWKSFFGDSALYVNPNNSDDIAEKIAELKSNQEKLQKMSINNIYLAKNEYNWDIEKEKLLNLYSNLSKKIN